MAALVRRMQDLGLLTERESRSLFLLLSVRGYRTMEPSDESRETSRILNTVLEHLRGDGRGINWLATQSGLPREVIEGLSFGLAVMPISGGGTGGRDSKGDHLRLVK